jgi:hypothetical protein
MHARERARRRAAARERVGEQRGTPRGGKRQPIEIAQQHVRDGRERAQLIGRM